jgi:hypothetical protein
MTNSNLVRELLNLVRPNPDDEPDVYLDLIDNLVAETPLDDLANVIAENTPPETEPWKVGALFDQLIWSTPDNGHSVTTECERWLMASDYQKVRYALAMTSPFPFIDGNEMVRVLLRVAQAWPDLRPRCEELIAERSLLPEDAN